MKTKKRMEEGFSLIEVTIALCILSFGILSLFLLISSGMRGSSSAGRITMGVNWASEQVEKIIGAKYDDDILEDISNRYGDSCSTADHCQREDNYVIFWNVRDDYPLENLKTVQIVVEYSQGDKNRVEFEYIKPGTI